MLKKLFTLALIATLFGASNGLAQQAEDIVIVDQDGKRVGAAKVDVVVDSGSNVDLRLDQKGDFKISGDKIIITDENGETKEIDISGARSVSVQKSTKSVNDNGNQKTVTRAKAIIIGPDGKKEVIELGNDDGQLPGDAFVFGGDLPEGLFVGDEPLAFQFFSNTLPGAKSAGSVSKYMIGVMCEPVSDALRLHLSIDGGLTVNSVSEDSPASQAGVETHDILMYVGDQQLATVADLTKLIDEAGENEQPITITAIRKGGEVSLEITPAERPANTMGQWVAPGVQFRRLGPGVIQLPPVPGQPAMPQMPAEFQQQMDQIRKQMEQMEREMMNRMKEKIEDDQ